MTFDELLHVLRASAEISKESSFVLVGSQAVLLLLDAPPADTLRSTEIDLYPANAPEKAALIDGSIGAVSEVDGLVDALDVDLPRKSSIRHWMQRRQAEALAP
jgi:hypothetical protein